MAENNVNNQYIAMVDTDEHPEIKNKMSQEEIDTLIKFLENHNDITLGEVLDQESIDKLIEVVRFINSKGMFL